MSNFKKKITKHETKHKTSRNNDVCNDDGDDDSHCCDHHHSGESENRQDSQENIDQFPIIYGRHIHAEDEENETDANTTTVYLDKPPFSIPLINCMAERLSFSDTKVPKYEKLPQNANDLEFQFDENTGNVHCKNGIVLQKTHFIEGYGVLTKKYSEQRLAEIAYFFERLPAFMPPLLTGIYQAIDETREKRKICSIVDVLKILYVTPRYKQDLIVYPRLAKLIAFLTKQNDACDSAKIQYCDVDINNTTAETYISLTILVLEILFTGGERMLVLDDIMYNEVAVLMAGQEFWKFLHLCIPAFDW